jgi:hypothetical protein
MQRAPAGAEIMAGLGSTFAATGMLTGFDKAVEIVLVAASPSRLTDLMTWF